MLHGRKRLISALTGITAIIAVGLVPSPSHAEPDLDTVKERVDRLYHEAEQASERYNDAKIELDELTKDLDSLEADEKRQAKNLAGVREQVQDSVVRQYQGESISTVGQVVVSEDPESFLAQLSTMSTFNDMQTSLFDDYSTELEALDIRREATEERVEDIAATKKRLGKEKAAIDAKVEQAEELLDELEAEERERLTRTASRSETRLPADAADAPDAPAASGRAGAAIEYAMAQVGDAYVYGAAGPDAFDCSGLTMMAWAQAGVGLPHSSSGQSASGTRVSSDDLQPGDLVFYYSPISHVGMYIGNGQIVHAANPGSGVTVAGVFSMPFSGAVRPG